MKNLQFRLNSAVFVFPIDSDINSIVTFDDFLLAENPQIFTLNSVNIAEHLSANKFFGIIKSKKMVYKLGNKSETENTDRVLGNTLQEVKNENLSENENSGINSTNKIEEELSVIMNSIPTNEIDLEIVNMLKNVPNCFLKTLSENNQLENVNNSDTSHDNFTTNFMFDVNPDEINSDNSNYSSSVLSDDNNLVHSDSDEMTFNISDIPVITIDNDQFNGETLENNYFSKNEIYLLHLTDDNIPDENIQNQHNVDSFNLPSGNYESNIVMANVIKKATDEGPVYLEFNLVDDRSSVNNDTNPINRKRKAENLRKVQPAAGSCSQIKKRKVKGTEKDYSQILKDAFSLFAKRTRTLYHWIEPYLTERQLRTTVEMRWANLSDKEKNVYISEASGCESEFGVMVNPQVTNIMQNRNCAEEINQAIFNMMK